MTRLAFVGESHGAEEEEASRKAGRPMPLVGASGRLFNSLLNTIGIERAINRAPSSGKITISQPADILVTNVFNIHPERNEVKRLFVPRKGSDLDWPALERGKYLDPALRPELDRLFRELAAFRPDCIIAMGNAALWALCKVTGIMARRGCFHQSVIGGRTVPVIPTVHPAFILRKFVWIVLAVSDFKKAAAVAAGRLKVERIGPPRFIARPTMADVRRLRTLRGPIIFDIETIPKFRTITCVGIGDATFNVCVPFVDMAAAGRSYWPTAAAEAEAWGHIKATLENPKTEKVTQVGSYDITWLREIAGIEPRGMIWDCRTLHHALWPELPHDLGAITTSFDDILMPPWKSEHDTAKRDN